MPGEISIDFDENGQGSTEKVILDLTTYFNEAVITVSQIVVGRLSVFLVSSIGCVLGHPDAVFQSKLAQAR